MTADPIGNPVVPAAVVRTDANLTVKVTANGLNPEIADFTGRQLLFTSIFLGKFEWEQFIRKWPFSDIFQLDF